jgi:WhiB family redox-sensing transcriptional regulator
MTELAIGAEPWREHAACASPDVNPDLFFPERRRFSEMQEQVRQAKAICAGCSVRSECLQFALDNHEQHGIFGGKTPTERRPSRMRATTVCRFCGDRFPRFENTRFCSPECRAAADDARMRARDRTGGWTNYGSLSPR